MEPIPRVPPPEFEMVMLWLNAPGALDEPVNATEFVLTESCGGRPCTNAVTPTVWLRPAQGAVPHVTVTTPA
jgi:hypothetical protein